MTAPTPRPRRPWRTYIAGIATMCFAFGLMNFVMGQQDPWGVRQIAGLCLAITGILLLAYARFVLK